MKRAGFTMIELIFVIVILGILAAVALPKFIGVAEQAQVGKLKAYIGTLNRTVAPALWSKSLSLGEGGSIAGTSHALFLTDAIAALESLDGITDGNTDVGTSQFAALSGCTDASVAANSVGDAVTAGSIQAAIAVGGVSYNIGCVDGSQTTAPSFYLSGTVDGTTETLVVK